MERWCRDELRAAAERMMMDEKAIRHVADEQSKLLRELESSRDRLAAEVMVLREALQFVADNPDSNGPIAVAKAKAALSTPSPRVAQIMEIVEGAKEFVAKVERGEARSVRTYGRFKTALSFLDKDADNG